ncbi:hypothetical protein [Shimia thalassica]|uniref:hypothetical protein n=1 Tax=Shimia thalassica TaxID=1715693 RepID=UPI0026E2F14B|nr:hypothetical protein [Shimia thalassica]MDO6479842.1 hypothetical protein [Shimia thalassica]
MPLSGKANLFRNQVHIEAQSSSWFGKLLLGDELYLMNGQLEKINASTTNLFVQIQQPKFSRLSTFKGRLDAFEIRTKYSEPHLLGVLVIRDLYYAAGCWISRLKTGECYLQIGLVEMRGETS